MLPVLATVLLLVAPTYPVLESHAAIRADSYEELTTPPESVISGEIVSLVGSIYETLNGTSPNQFGSLPAESVAETTIHALYSKVATSSEFSNVYSAHDPGNFTIEASYNSSVGITSADFVDEWDGDGTVYNEYWDGSASTGLIQGPTLVSYPAAHAAMYLYESTNWAGWDFWTPYANEEPLHSNGADANVATVSVPPQSPQNVPAGQHVISMITAWTSLMENSSGTQLLQTGYNAIPTSGGSATYTLWWEFWPYNNQQDYASPPTVHAGDEIRELEYQDAGTADDYTLQCYDYTDSAGVAVTGSAAYENPGWSPWMGASVVEAYALGGDIQQIANFSNVNFENGLLWQDTSVSGVYDVYNYTQLYNDGSEGDIYQLGQSQTCVWIFCNPVPNTDQNYQSGWSWNGYYYGYPQVSWVTSSYDWNYVN